MEGKHREQEQRPRTHKRNWPFRLLLIAAALLILAVILVSQVMGMDQVAFAARFKNSPVAIPVLAALYLLKAATVVLLPQPLLYLLTGLLFSPLVSFLLTLGFLFLEFTLDYTIGKHFGKKLMDKLLSWLRGRSKTLDRLLDGGALTSFGSIAALRLMPGVSTDSVSLIAGAQEAPYGRYLLASYLGALPQAATLTLMGSSAHDPLSPQFLAPMGAFVVILVVAFLVKRRVDRRAKPHNALGQKDGEVS